MADPKEKQGRKSPLLGRDLDAMMATTEAAKALEKKIIERSREDNDGFVGSGYMARNQSVEGGEVTQKKKKKEKDEKAIKRILKQQLKELNAKIEALLKENERLRLENEQLQNDIDENEREIEALKQENAQLENLQDRLENGEDPESIKQDPAYKKAAEEYRKKTGKDPDKADPADILIWQQQQNKSKIGGLEGENRDKGKKIEDNKKKIDENEQKVEEHKAEKKVKQEKVAELERKAEILKKENTQPTEEIRQLQAEIEENKHNIEELNGKIHGLIYENKKYDIKVETLKQENPEAESFALEGFGAPQDADVLDGFVAPETKQASVNNPLDGFGAAPIEGVADGVKVKSFAHSIDPEGVKTVALKGNFNDAAPLHKVPENEPGGPKQDNTITDNKLV